jgi:hypothetical protein
LDEWCSCCLHRIECSTRIGGTINELNASFIPAKIPRADSSQDEKERKVSKRNKNDLLVAESLLPEVRTLADNAITFRQKNNYVGSHPRTRVVVQDQDMAIDRICSVITRLHNA